MTVEVDASSREQRILIHNDIVDVDASSREQSILIHNVLVGVDADSREQSIFIINNEMVGEDAPISFRLSVPKY